MFLNVIYINFSENQCSVRCHPTGLFNVHKYYYTKTYRESQVYKIWIKISRVEEEGRVAFLCGLLSISSICTRMEELQLTQTDT